VFAGRSRSRGFVGTQQLLPLVPGGEFARGLAHGRTAALNLDRKLREDRTGRFQPLAAGAPQLDIVVWKLKAETSEQSSELAQKVFDACAARDLHLALVQLPLKWFEPATGLEPESLAAKARVGDLPALGIDEARARGLAGPHLGEADRELRRGDGKIAQRPSAMRNFAPESLLFQEHPARKRLARPGRGI